MKYIFAERLHDGSYEFRCDGIRQVYTFYTRKESERMFRQRLRDKLKVKRLTNVQITYL